jgi:hypothetical protein
MKNLLNFCNSALSVFTNILCSSVSLRFSPGFKVASAFVTGSVFSGMLFRHFFSFL